jgi:hypothetical protein
MTVCSSLGSWTLWALPIGLPFPAMLTGCVTLLRNSNGGTEERQATGHPYAAIHTRPPTRVSAAATLAARLNLAVVVLHMPANWPTGGHF